MMDLALIAGSVAAAGLIGGAPVLFFVAFGALFAAAYCWITGK